MSLLHPPPEEMEEVVGYTELETLQALEEVTDDTDAVKIIQEYWTAGKVRFNGLPPSF